MATLKLAVLSLIYFAAENRHLELYAVLFHPSVSIYTSDMLKSPAQQIKCEGYNGRY